MRLTDLAIQRLPIPPTGQKTYWEGGFGVRVSQGGSKTFVVMFGKERRLKTLGRYPDISLKNARREAQAFLATKSRNYRPNSLTSFFALEYQNEGTVTREDIDGTSVYKKFLSYIDVFKNKTYKTEWNIPNLNILFVFQDRTQMNEAIKKAESMIGPTNIFRFMHIPRFYETPNGSLLAPKLFPEIITEHWLRAGMEPKPLFTPSPSTN